MKPYSCNALLFLDEGDNVKKTMHVNYFTINATNSKSAYAKRDAMYPEDPGFCAYLEGK